MLLVSMLLKYPMWNISMPQDINWATKVFFQPLCWQFGIWMVV